MQLKLIVDQDFLKVIADPKSKLVQPRKLMSNVAFVVCYPGFQIVFLCPQCFDSLTWEDGEMGSGPSASVLTFDLLVVNGLTVLLTAGSPLAFWRTDKNRDRVEEDLLQDFLKRKRRQNHVVLTMLLLSSTHRNSGKPKTDFKFVSTYLKTHPLTLQPTRS